MNAATPETDSVRGDCHVSIAFDVGHAIDLDRARRIPEIGTPALRVAAGRPRTFPFDPQPEPVRVWRESPSLVVGEFRTRDRAEIVLYDFGAISIIYTIGLESPLDRLPQLAADLYDNEALVREGIRCIEILVKILGDAIREPEIFPQHEDYVVFLLDPHSFDVAQMPKIHASVLARTLRAERGTLSSEEVSDALSARLSYSERDIVLVDWNAALVIDAEPDDIRAILEFANVRLLEMRFLDVDLDQALDEAYIALSTRRPRRFPQLFRSSRELTRVAMLQADAALLYEDVTNALKLVGDQYLARVYRAISNRFHLERWDEIITRKLEALESIYQKLSDREANRRLEILEWIIILLILVSILLPLVFGVGAH